MNNKILVLASGGLDSSVVLALYKYMNYDITVMYFDYGNLNSKAEKEALMKLCKKLNITKIEDVKLNINWSSGGCLVEDNEDMYIEMRNLIFLSNAISYAQAKGIKSIAVGFIGGEGDYDDTTEQFLYDLNTLSINTTGILIKAPLKLYNKSEVYKLGLKFGVNLKNTYSCNKGQGKPCGKCYDCKDLLDLVEQENIPNELNPFK